MGQRQYFKDGRIELTHYGAAAWKLTDGKHTILLDPYFTRLRYSGKRFGMLPANAAPGDDRPAHSFDDIVASDTDIIDQHITDATHILLSHAHFNHCMDMPYIAKKTGALVVGSYSATNIASAYGVEEEKLITVRGGEDYDFGEISIRVIPSLHSALCDKCYFDAGIVPENLKGPLPLKAFSEGGTFGYLIRFKNQEILLFGSMNYIEREVQGLTPSVILVPAARPRLQIWQYTSRLLRATALPKVVVATHWDVQTYPYGADQSAALEQAASFQQEVTEVSPESTQVLPKHFETFAVHKDHRVEFVEPANASPAASANS